jgi:hypothetical protein
MSEFKLYFLVGKDHILDYANGYDHILFVVALCALYQLRDWKKLLILITAFTIGHSITLALATFNIIQVRFELTEFLVAASILVTAISNLFKSEDGIGPRAMQLNYFYAGFFAKGYTWARPGYRITTYSL